MTFEGVYTLVSLWRNFSKSRTSDQRTPKSNRRSLLANSIILLVFTVIVLGCEVKKSSINEGVWTTVRPKSVSSLASPKGMIRVYMLKDLEDADAELMDLVKGTPSIRSNGIACDLISSHTAEETKVISRTYLVPNGDQYVGVSIWGADAERQVAFITFNLPPRERTTN